MQFLNKRRLSSQVVPKCSTEANIDDVYIHEVVVANNYLSRNVNEKNTNNLTFLDNVDLKNVKELTITNEHIPNYFNYCTDSMRVLGLTSDDYIERRSSSKLNIIPSISMNDVDFSKCNEVYNIQLFIYKIFAYVCYYLLALYIK